MRYDYACGTCGNVTEHNIPFEDRHTPQVCECGGKAAYRFPVSARFVPFETYYDETLGFDVHGRRERKEALRAFGLIEAGDSVNGARNVESSPHAEMIKPLPPRGITLSDIQKREEGSKKALESFEISVVEKATGKTIMPKTRAVDLPSA